MPITAHPSRMPRSLSSTALGIYERCPREFALSYLTDEPDPRLPTPQLVLGNTVHAALAGYMRLPAAKRTAERAHQLLRHHWSMSPRAVAFIHREEEAAWGQQGLTMLTRFCESGDGARNPFAIEEWVRARLPNGRRVCGRIDRADRTDDGLAIVDYKTGNRPEDFVAADQVAARVYALAGFRTFHQPIAAVRFLWLATGRVDEWHPQADDMAEVEDDLAETTERLCTDRIMEPRPSGWCRRCPFADRCPVRFAGAGGEALPAAADLPF